MSVTFIPHLDSLERYVTVHAIKALRVSRGTAPLILNLSTRWTWVVNFTPWPFHPRERKPIPTRLPQSLSGLLDNKKSHLRRFFLILLYSVRISSTIDYLSWFFLILPFLSSRTTHNKQTSIPPTGFETAIPASDRPQTLALDRSATGIGKMKNFWGLFWCTSDHCIPYPAVRHTNHRITSPHADSNPGPSTR